MRGVDPEKSLKIAEALVKGGVKLLEVTFDPSDPDTAEKTASVIARISEKFDGKLIMGAGTVVKPEYVKAAKDVGVKYIISPNVDPEIIRLTKELGMLSIPGAYTPTECMNALNAGADIVKLFPTTVQDIGYIINISRPLSHMKYLCTGGVTDENAAVKFLEAGASAVGTGLSVINPEMVKNENYDGIAELARRHVEAIKAFKNR
jgi:2-dehydro-3-deoxyphosphogluconate aldolase/(4S)-4-hydroxy-2-oxoglutarate aldolase